MRSYWSSIASSVGGRTGEQIAGSSGPSDDVHGAMPEYGGDKTIVYDSAGSENEADEECHHNATSALIAMGQAEQERGEEHDGPGFEADLRKNSHGEAAIEKFLAEAGGDSQGEIREELQEGLREDAFGHGLEAAAGLTRDFADAAKIEPLQGGNCQSADNGGDDHTEFVVKKQAELSGSEMVGPGAPGDDCDGAPLESYGRSIEREAFFSSNNWLGQELFHAHTAAPRQHHAQHQKNYPHVPRHAQIRTLSVGIAQVRKVPFELGAPAKARMPGPRYNQDASQRGAA
jgi:hypothetical protein